MRIAIWSYTVAVGMATAIIAMLGAMFEDILPGLFNGKPLPPLTGLLTAYHWWVLIISIPWIFVAVRLTHAETISIEKAMAFAGVSTFTIVALFASTAFALTLPFVTLHGSL